MNEALVDEPITVDGLQYALNAFDVLKCVTSDCLYLNTTKWDQREFLKQAFEENSIIPVLGTSHGHCFDGDYTVTGIRYNELGTLQMAVLERKKDEQRRTF